MAKQDKEPVSSNQEVSEGTAGTTGASPSSTDTSSGANDMAAQLKAALAERDANQQNWLRAQADLENYRKRTQKEIEQDRQYRALPLARDLLPGLDNLHRALDAARTSKDLQKLVDGVQMVVKQFDDILARHSIVPIEAVGKPFDANLHQALQQVPTADKPPMTVLSEYERGYTLYDRVVRPSTVIVSSAPAEAPVGASSTRGDSAP